MNEQATTLRALKGAAASVVLALAVTGRSMTNRELRLWTGYSDKPITEALALLDVEGITQYNGRQFGWSLSAGQMLLPLPTHQHKLSTDKAQLSTGDRKVSDLGPTTTTTKDLRSRKDKVVVEEETATSEILRSMLASAGVGANSKGMRDILSAEVEVERAAAWVTYWRWWKRERKRRPGQSVDGRAYFTAGLLIRVLLDGDEPPAERCEGCLELSADCYCNVVSR